MRVNITVVCILLVLITILRHFVVPAVAKQFTERLRTQGYLTEEHQVVTEDGYILIVFRVRRESCSEKMRHPPLILQHGLMQSSDSWFDAGPKAALGYLIANSCFDLWVPNTRGNYYSKGHIHLNADRDAEFWDWSYDQIGKYDVSAVIDYVLKFTDSLKLNYVGFSQGAGCFFIMCTERPEHCNKVGVNIALSPVTRLTHTTSIVFLYGFHIIASHQNSLTALGIYDALSDKEITATLMNLVCPIHHHTRNCTSLMALVDTYHKGSISFKTHQVMFNHLPAGTSIKNLVQYNQGFYNDLNIKFDYGRRKNLELYGQESPPAYNLSLVTAPVVIIQGQDDRIINIEDTKWAYKKLANVLELIIVEDPNWNHLDMTYSRFIPHLLFPNIKKYLLQFSSV